MLKGKYPVDRDDSIQLAALQLQLEQGEYHSNVSIK